MWHLIKENISLVSLGVSIFALSLGLYRDVWLTPKVRHSVEERRESAGDAGHVRLRYVVEVRIRSVGWATATDVDMRVAARNGAVIVQAHADREEFAERLADIGRHALPEVFITIRRMVPGERVAFTFWYGVPGSPDYKPPVPLVRVRHAAELSEVEGRPQSVLFRADEVIQ